MATRSSISITLLLLIILLSTLCPSSSSSNRSMQAVERKGNQMPSCNDMLSRSQCWQNPKCRWCRSESLDDMCFTKTEAWRLPRQVFLCDS